MTLRGFLLEPNKYDDFLYTTFIGLAILALFFVFLM